MKGLTHTGRLTAHTVVVVAVHMGAVCGFGDLCCCQIHISAAVLRLKKAASVEMLDEPAQTDGAVSISTGLISKWFMLL